LFFIYTLLLLQKVHFLNFRTIYIYWRKNIWDIDINKLQYWSTQKWR